MRAIVCLAVAAILAGCAQEPPAESVKPVTVQVTAADFCQIMRGLYPGSGKPTWSARDTPETIYGVRRLAAAVDTRCRLAPIRKPQPTT